MYVQIGEVRTLKKSSSCSTIYLDDSTVSQPNLKNTLKCVSFAIYYHIKNRTSERHLDIFDEKLHPLTVSSARFFMHAGSVAFLKVPRNNRNLNNSAEAKLKLWNLWPQHFPKLLQNIPKISLKFCFLEPNWKCF